MLAVTKQVAGGGGGEGGGTPLYKPYRYLPPRPVVFFSLFGLKTGMVFEGTTVAHERSYRFNSKLILERNRNMRIRSAFEEFFCLCSNISHDGIIST